MIIVFFLNLTKPKPPIQFIMYRNFKNINYLDLISDASNMPWHEIAYGEDLDGMVETFSSFLTHLFNKHAPLVSKRVTKQPAPWLTDFIRQLQKQRDAAFRKARRTKSQIDWTSYKRLRNYTQQQIRNSKARFLHYSLSQKQSSKKLWSKLKDLGIGKSNSKGAVLLDLNTINDYFVNIPVDSA